MAGAVGYEGVGKGLEDWGGWVGGGTTYTQVHRIDIRFRSWGGPWQLLQGVRSLCWAAGMWCHLWREADNHATRTTQLGDVRLKERAHVQTTHVYTPQRSGIPLALPTDQSCMQTTNAPWGLGLPLAPSTINQPKALHLLKALSEN